MKINIFSQPIFLCFFLVVFAPLGIDLYLPAMVAIGENFHANSKLTLSFYILGLALGQLFSGTIAGKFNIKSIIGYNFALFTLASFAIFFTNTFSLLLLFRFLQGLAVGGFVLSWSYIALSLSRGEKLAVCFSWLNAALNTVPVLAPLLGSLILDYLPWRFIFLLLGLYSLLLLSTLHKFNLNSVPKNNFSINESRLILKDFSFKYYGFSCCLALAFIFCYVGMAPDLIMNKFGKSYKYFSLLFSTNAFLVMSISYFAPFLVKKLGREKVFNLGLLMLLSSGFLLLVTNSFLSPLLFMFCINIGCLGFGVFRGAAKSLVFSNCQNNLGLSLAIFGFIELLFAGSVNYFFAVFNFSTLALGLIPFAFLLLFLYKKVCIKLKYKY